MQVNYENKYLETLNNSQYNLDLFEKLFYSTHWEFSDITLNLRFVKALLVTLLAQYGFTHHIIIYFWNIF